MPGDHGTATDHRTLVDSLTRDLRPVRPPWSPWLRLAGWVVLALATVAVAGLVGLRQDLALQLERPPYLVTLGILLAGGGLAATTALLAAVPGRIAPREARRIAIGLLVLAVGAALLGEPTNPQTVAAFLLTGLRCAACVAAFGLAPWMLLFAELRRAAPLDGRVAGLCAGVAALLVGAASVRVACPFDDTLHLAAWHGLPVVVWALASAVAGGAWLVRWMDAAPEPRES